MFVREFADRKPGAASGARVQGRATDLAAAACDSAAAAPAVDRLVAHVARRQRRRFRSAVIDERSLKLTKRERKRAA